MNYGTLLVILLTANLGATELDRYGGWMDVKGEATGSFHIETIQGRDILITPDGHGFVLQSFISLLFVLDYVPVVTVSSYRIVN